MPSADNTKNKQLALRPENVETVSQQPRQPESLQGLLRFAMQAQNSATTSNSSELRPLDEERKEFLEDALNSMTVDVIKLMQENINIIKNDRDLDNKITAFDTILDYIDNMDIANDFHKINGFVIFEPSFHSEYHEVRAYGCDLLAELAQNNAYIQNVISESTNFMVELFTLIENDENDGVQVKAMYAISCIVRDSKVGFENFQKQNGFEIMKKVITRNNAKLRTKIAFLLGALGRIDPKVVEILVRLDFPSTLLDLLGDACNESHEHILMLLALLVENSEGASVDRERLKDVIANHLELVQGKDAYKDEQECCEKILATLE